MGTIRSLAKYFYDTKLAAKNGTKGAVNEKDYFSTEFTIDELYALVYSNASFAQLQRIALPLKFALDAIMTSNVLMDFNPATKRLAAAHFDCESFTNASRRILKTRQLSN